MTHFSSLLRPYFIRLSLFYYIRYLLVRYQNKRLCFPKSRYLCRPQLMHILPLFYEHCAVCFNTPPLQRALLVQTSVSTDCVATTGVADVHTDAYGS